MVLALSLAALGAGHVLAQAPAPAPAQAPPAAEAKPAQAPPAAEAKPAQAPAAAPLPRPEPIPEVQLAPALRTTPVRSGAAGYNVHLVDASVLPRDRAPQVMYVDQTGNFNIGQKLTGQTSEATGTVSGDNDEGTSGTLTLGNMTGKFQDGETIADEAGGSATVLGKMREGIWVLDFAFKPARLATVELPGRGRQQVLYLYYRVINRTGEPRMFVPQFFLVTDDGKRYEDTVLPQAVQNIQGREDSTTPLLGAVTSTGMIPPSTKQGIDDAVYGVAVWLVNDPIAKADAFQIFVRGLSDGYRTVTPAEGKEPVTEYKTLRIDFSRPGDERHFNEREIRLLDPPYEWIYY
jgi:hypothetical protein